MTPKTIAVHGTSGSQGAPVAAVLAARGHTVRPITRAAGADLLDPASLEAAYTGAAAVVLHLPLVYDERVLTMAGNAARAAERAGVAHLVINTGGPLPPGPIGVPFVDARHVAAAARVERVTVLEPVTYLENFTAPWSRESIVRDGVLRYPLPAEAPAPWVAMEDVARAAAVAIDREVAGSFALPGAPRTGADVTAALGDAIGRPVRWEQIEPEAFADLLRPYLGDHAADGTGAVYRMMQATPPPPPADPEPARHALDWAPRSVEQWAAAVAWPVASAA
jgi:nucleoside-diphosphate-sugar epimerase